MIVITGATGTVGREVMALLAPTGHGVTAITRSPSAAASFPDGVAAIVGDAHAPASLDGAWKDVEAVLISPRAVGDAAPRLLAAAAEHGARRVVVISAVTVSYPAGEERFIRHFREVEDAARASGLAWTFLRCSEFAANSLSWSQQIRTTGVVHGAYAGAATSPIHPRDIAEVAVQALTSPGHEGRAYVLTGPQSLTQADKLAIIGQETGRELTFVEVPPDQLRSAMLARGIPADIPDRLLGSLADWALSPCPTTATVAHLLGRPARTFASWACENADAFLGG